MRIVMLPLDVSSREDIPNRILRSLEPTVYAQLAPYLELIRFPLGTIIDEPGQPLDEVYFPNHGVLSMLTVLENGELVEVATIGNEGMADLSVFLGLKIARSRLLCQVPGDTLRISTAIFLDLVERNPGLRTALGSYMISMFILVSQFAACNRLHPLSERFARRILMTHDRIDSDSFPLSQAFLATTLGVRPASIAAAADMLQKAGLVHHRRGRMTVIDRQGLEAATCECYAVVRDQFESMSGGEINRPGRRRLSSGRYAVNGERAQEPT